VCVVRAEQHHFVDGRQPTPRPSAVEVALNRRGGQRAQR
jgi:hypothetical protein